MGGLEDQNPAFLHERAQPRRLPVYNAYMKPVGYIKNYKQTFHLTHNGSIRGECWPLPFAQIWPQTKGKKKHLANISAQCKCSWRQRQETRTWLINMSTRSNGVKLQSGAISVPPCPTRVPMRRCRHDESEARHCPPPTPPDGTTPTRQGESTPWMTDAVHHLFRLQGLVVEDEGDTSADHLQPPSAVEDGAALPRNGHWGGGEREKRGSQRCVKSTFSCFRCILWIEVCR